MLIIQWKDGTRWELPTNTSPPKNFRIVHRLQARLAKRINK